MGLFSIFLAGVLPGRSSPGILPYFLAAVHPAALVAYRLNRAWTLILAKHDRGHPAGHQRHRSRDQSVDESVLAGGRGDELLEADLDDLEGGFGPRHQRAVG